MRTTDPCRFPSSKSGGQAVVALILLLFLGVAALWAPSAEAQTQTSGSILAGPDCCQNTPPGNVGTPNQTIHIAIRIQSSGR